MNTEQLKSISKGIVKIPLVYGVTVTNADNLKMIDFTKKNLSKEYLEKNLLSYNFKIEHNFNNNMENKMNEESKKSFGEKIEAFFETMKYQQPQKALFYLGRMLNTIALKQIEHQHHKKPILSKLNFNGMDKNEILRLHSDLFEKARQYGIVDKVEFDNSKFTSFFDVNNWSLPPQESLFFILAGYSFGLAISTSNETDYNNNNNSEEQNDNN